MGLGNVEATDALRHPAPPDEPEPPFWESFRLLRIPEIRAGIFTKKAPPIPAVRKNVVLLTAAEASSLFREAETVLGRILAKLERLRELAMQATNVNLTPGERQAIMIEAQGLAEEIIQNSAALRITDRPLLQVDSLWVDIETPIIPGLKVAPPSRVSFNVSSQRMPVVFLRNLSFRLQVSAIAALQFLRQVIEDVAKVELELKQARAELQALMDAGLLSSEDASLSGQAQARAKNVIEDLVLQAQFVAGAQANIDARQVLELMIEDG